MKFLSLLSSTPLILLRNLTRSFLYSSLRLSTKLYDVLLSSDELSEIVIDEEDDRCHSEDAFNE
jgi:hypothetical protein